MFICSLCCVTSRRQGSDTNVAWLGTHSLHDGDSPQKTDAMGWSAVSCFSFFFPHKWTPIFNIYTGNDDFFIGGAPVFCPTELWFKLWLPSNPCGKTLASGRHVSSVSNDLHRWWNWYLGGQAGMTYNHPKTITPISCIFYGAKAIVFLDQWSVNPGLFTAVAVGLAGRKALRGNTEVTTTSYERFMLQIATHEQNHKAMINEGVIVRDNIYSSFLRASSVTLLFLSSILQLKLSKSYSCGLNLCFSSGCLWIIDNSPQRSLCEKTLFLFSDNGDFYPGYPGYNDFYPGQGQDGNVNFLPPNGPGGPLDQVPHPAGKKIPLVLNFELKPTFCDDLVAQRKSRRKKEKWLFAFIFVSRFWISVLTWIQCSSCFLQPDQKINKWCTLLLSTLLVCCKWQDQLFHRQFFFRTEPHPHKKEKKFIAPTSDALFPEQTHLNSILTCFPKENIIPMPLQINNRLFTYHWVNLSNLFLRLSVFRGLSCLFRSDFGKYSFCGENNGSSFGFPSNNTNGERIVAVWIQHWPFLLLMLWPRCCQTFNTCFSFFKTFQARCSSMICSRITLGTWVISHHAMSKGETRWKEQRKLCHWEQSIRFRSQCKLGPMIRAQKAKTWGRAGPKLKQTQDWGGREMERAQYWNWAILSNLVQMGKVNTARGDCAGDCKYEKEKHWREIGCVGWENAGGDWGGGSAVEVGGREEKKSAVNCLHSWSIFYWRNPTDPSDGSRIWVGGTRSWLRCDPGRERIHSDLKRVLKWKENGFAQNLWIILRGGIEYPRNPPR